MRPGQSTGCSRSQEVGNATTASAIETFSGRHLSGFVCHRRMQPYSSPPDRLKNTLPHVGPTTSLRTVILRGDRGLAHTVAMIEVTCDVSFGSNSEVGASNREVRFTPNTGHCRQDQPCPKSATSRLMHRSNSFIRSPRRHSAMSGGGTVRPMTLAVLRLMISSTLVDLRDRQFGLASRP